MIGTPPYVPFCRIPLRNDNPDRKPETADQITAGDVAEEVDAQVDPAEADQCYGDGSPEHHLEARSRFGLDGPPDAVGDEAIDGDSGRRVTAGECGGMRFDQIPV